MKGCFALVLHAHLPFVRHPEHERFLEEGWLFEAITESYLPLLRVFEGWREEGMCVSLTLTLTPTLCSMLQDSLLRERYERYLDDQIELAEKEVIRTTWEKPLQKVALLYLEKFQEARRDFGACHGDLIGRFSSLQDSGHLEIITCAATHAVLPLLLHHPESIRAQLLVARDHYTDCFGRKPRGIWLPECAYSPELDSFLQEAGLHWFILDTHGIMHARPRPRYGVFAPLLTPKGLAAFGRDIETARQVWSRHEGYPGDPRYRDFYRDIGFDLDWEYLKGHLVAAGQRAFTGLKYFSITGHGLAKKPFDRSAAMRAVDDQTHHFLAGRVSQFQQLRGIVDRPAIVVAPYDAELFGHWWYEGPEFLDMFVRKAYYDQQEFVLGTPQQFLDQFPRHQVAIPSPSSWGEGGYWSMWLSHENEWVFRELAPAQERMKELARRFAAPSPLELRALAQAARELLLAQSSDWSFILRANTSSGYARQRVQIHLERFSALYSQLTTGQVNEAELALMEAVDNLFPGLNYRYWA